MLRLKPRRIVRAYSISFILQDDLFHDRSLIVSLRELVRSDLITFLLGSFTSQLAWELTLPCTPSLGLFLSGPGPLWLSWRINIHNQQSAATPSAASV